MKRKLFFADLNYITSGREWTIIPFPLNVGYIAAFAQKMLPDQFDIRIFKHPDRFLSAIENEKPDMVAFSNYIWNRNLQLTFARHLKSLHPGCITAMGGPNYNFTEPTWVERFARENRAIDFHIEGEGETKFYNLASCSIAHGFNIEKIKRANPAGTAYLRPDDDSFVWHKNLKSDELWSDLPAEIMDIARGRLLNLNDVPSPYLTGLLDEFLDDPDFCPIIETNRGCPYSCTFCNWGAMGKSKSAMFDMDRVVTELRYIAARNKSKTPYLYIGDANFGLFPRDVEIANLLHELKENNGFPQSVYLYFAKNSSEKVVRIAEILKDMTPISLSRQTQNNDVLKIIKRSNISIGTFNTLSTLAKSLGIDSNVELIYSLPGESRDSFLNGVREVAKQNVDGLHMFPAMLLDGSEMSTEASRKRYGIKGEWRLIDGCAGSYGPIRAMEFEEIITSTSVLRRQEHIELRLFHFLQCLFLDTKIYKDTASLLPPELTLVDLMQEIIDRRHEAPAPIRNLLEDFMVQSESELLQQPIAEPTQEQVDRALDRSIKLNPLYISRLLYEPGVRQAFHAFLKTCLIRFGGTNESEIATVFELIDAQIYPFDGSTDYAVTLSIDAVAFANRSVGDPVADYLLPAGKDFHFHKPYTYMQFVKSLGQNRPLAEKVYEILVHHTHETFRRTLVPMLIGEADTAAMPDAAIANGERGKRVIRLEGGWLY